MAPRNPITDEALAILVAELAPTTSVGAMAASLHVSEIRIVRAAYAHGVAIPHLPPKYRGWRPRLNARAKSMPEDVRAESRKLRVSTGDAWEDFMLFGPVRPFTAWRLPNSAGARL